MSSFVHSLAGACAAISTTGYAIYTSAIPTANVSAAVAELWRIYPTPEEFASGADERCLALKHDPFAGIVEFPFPGRALHRLVVHPALVALAEEVLEQSDLRIYQVMLWAKYAGATRYEQLLHADYPGHTLLVPSFNSRQLITFTYLSDVNPSSAPTRVVARPHVPVLRQGTYTKSAWPDLYAVEVDAVGPAGTILAYEPDVLHRATEFVGDSGARFTLTVSFKTADADWAGHHSWPKRAGEWSFSRFIAQATPRERELFGFPPPGNPFWTKSTLSGVAKRYPGMDIAPYAAALQR